jgi:hypothetical protein
MKMCRYISFFFDDSSDNPADTVRVACPWSHGRTEEWLQLNPEGPYTEGHYLPGGIVECRIPYRTSARAANSIIYKWPTFADFEAWVTMQTIPFYPAGYDEAGYDRRGFDKNGYDEEGYNRRGYDEDGRDREGYDEDGYDRDGYDAAGRDRDGYDEEGYDEEGYDVYGYDEYGYDRDGRDEDGARGD